jgi:phosphatidylglycerol---prolipoprotein diacylglyceryl transferase
MNPVLIPIYGSLSIQSYGLMLLIGFLLFWWLTERHPLRKNLMSEEVATNFITYTVAFALIGGRVGDIIGSPGHYPTFFSWFAIWEGGLSVLGATVAIICGGSLFLYKHHVSILAVADLITLYMPIIHVFGRIGCFIAGCCYGVPTTAWWAVTYTHPQVAAPLCVPLHPTQLYSAFLFALIAILLPSVWYVFRPPRGTIAFLYLLLAATERFLIDFVRENRRMLGYLSFHQWLALGLIIVAIVSLIVIRYKTRNK